MKRVLVGLLCIPVSLFTIWAGLSVPDLMRALSLAMYYRAARFLSLATLLGVFWVLPGLWLLHGYWRALLQWPLPTSWRRFWLIAAGLNAVFFLGAMYGWLMWGYPGTPIEPLLIVPVLNPFVTWLPLDGGLFCLWQLVATTLSLVLAQRYADTDADLVATAAHRLGLS